MNLENPLLLFLATWGLLALTVAFFYGVAALRKLLRGDYSTYNEFPSWPICPHCKEKMTKSHIQCEDGSGWYSAWLCECEYSMDGGDKSQDMEIVSERTDELADGSLLKSKLLRREDK